MEELNRNNIERQQHMWLDKWSEKMLEIWRDRLTFFDIKDTGALIGSFSEDIAHDGLSANIVMRFLSYGIYQAYGVGYGYTHGNGGDLPFLDATYRKEHGLDRVRKVGPAWGGYYTSGDPRERRHWFGTKLFASTMRLKETMAHMVGEAGAAILCEALEDARKTIVK